VSDDVRTTANENSRCEVVAQVKNAPRKGTALGDLDQGEDDEETEQSVLAQRAVESDVVHRRFAQRGDGG
jgi:hypothetical protein